MTNEIYWAIARSTGAAAIALLTLSVALGILARSGKTYLSVPRFATNAIHRSSSLLALVFTTVHIITLLLDSYTGLSLYQFFIPFTTADNTLAYGLGTLAFDLILALAITGLLRSRIPEKLFHGIHWASYACWPVALFHGLTSGSDVGEGWFLTLTLSCIATIGAATIYRILPLFGNHRHTSRTPLPASTSSGH